MSDLTYPLFDKARAKAHGRRNLFHSLLLVGGIGGLMAFGAWLLWGLGGVIGSFVVIILLTLFGPQLSTEVVMRLFKAKPVDPARCGPLIEVIGALAQRAELPSPPKLYIVPSKILNAFAVGTPQKSSIAVTSGLLNILSDREIIGILAHEISHIRSNDLWVMGLADMMSRFTQTLSTLGLFFMFFNIYAWLVGKALFMPWSVALLLYFMPLASSLLQLALSRAREYDADLDAAKLTGDPDGLSSALARLERHQGKIWEDMVPGGRRIAIPSVLRSHPESVERIKRLSELQKQTPDRNALPHTGQEAALTHALRPLPHHRGLSFPGIRL